MEGSAKIISLIARDEAQHLAITQHILKCYQNQEKDKVMLKVMKDCEPDVYKMYEDAVNEEKDRPEYLFMHGSMLGLSIALLSQYVEYIANRRLRAIGLKPSYMIYQVERIHCHGLNTGCHLRDNRMHLKKQRLNLMS